MRLGDSVVLKTPSWPSTQRFEASDIEVTTYPSGVTDFSWISCSLDDASLVLNRQQVRVLRDYLNTLDYLD